MNQILQKRVSEIDIDLERGQMAEEAKNIFNRVEKWVEKGEGRLKDVRKMVRRCGKMVKKCEQVAGGEKEVAKKGYERMEFEFSVKNKDLLEEERLIAKFKVYDKELMVRTMFDKTNGCIRFKICFNMALSANEIYVVYFQCFNKNHEPFLYFECVLDNEENEKIILDETEEAMKAKCFQKSKNQDHDKYDFYLVVKSIQNVIKNVNNQEVSKLQKDMSKLIQEIA
jgi:hypothetical protein